MIRLIHKLDDHVLVHVNVEEDIDDNISNTKELQLAAIAKIHEEHLRYARRQSVTHSKKSNDEISESDKFKHARSMSVGESVDSKQNPLHFLHHPGDDCHAIADFPNVGVECIAQPEGGKPRSPLRNNSNNHSNNNSKRNDQLGDAASVDHEDSQQQHF